MIHAIDNPAGGRDADIARPLSRKPRESDRQRAADAVRLRKATLEDLPELRALHARSMRALGRGHYETETIEAFVARGSSVDAELILAGTYFVAEVEGVVVASGGWSPTAGRRALALGLSSASKVDPGETRLPVVRAIFVDPLFAGHGLGGLTMDRIEGEIARAGFRRAMLCATLPGAAFYRARGWAGDQPFLVPVAEGRVMVSLKMEKALPRAA